MPTAGAAALQIEPDAPARALANAAGAADAARPGDKPKQKDKEKSKAIQRAPRVARCRSVEGRVDGRAWEAAEGCVEGSPALLAAIRVVVADTEGAAASVGCKTSSAFAAGAAAAAAAPSSGLALGGRPRLFLGGSSVPAGGSSAVVDSALLGRGLEWAEEAASADSTQPAQDVLAAPPAPSRRCAR